MNQGNQRALVLGSLSIFAAVMLSFILLRPYFKMEDAEVTKEDIIDKTENISVYNIYIEDSDLSNYRKIIYFGGNGFENIQNGVIGRVYDKALLDGSNVCMYTSYYEFEHAIKDANDKLHDAFIYYDIDEKSSESDTRIQIFYDERFIIPDYDSKSFARDISTDLDEYFKTNQIKCNLICSETETTALSEAMMPAVYIKLEGNLHNNKNVKDFIAKEVLKTACKIMIQKERGQ